MIIARRRLKVKVKVMGQAIAVGATSIEGSYFLVTLCDHAMSLLNIATDTCWPLYISTRDVWSFDCFMAKYHNNNIVNVYGAAVMAVQA